MKILHLTPTYYPAYRNGGPVLSVHNLNKWLVKRGVEVTVYTTNVDGAYGLNVPLGQEVVIDGVKVYYFPVNCLPKKWSYSREFHRFLVKNIRHFDLIHITSVFLAFSALGGYYARKFHKPYVISPRGSLMEEPLKKKFLKKSFYIALWERYNLKLADLIHFTAENEKKEYFKLGFPTKNFVVIPNSFDDSEFQQLIDVKNFKKKFGLTSDKKIILFLSRINWKKGFDTLIPALAEVGQKEPRALLLICGGDDEKYRRVVEALVREYHAESMVKFTDMVTGSDKIAALAAAEIFVLPSYSENFGMAVVEAMYAGLPVVITQEVGISPQIKKNQAGLIIKKDIHELSEAILSLLGNPALAETMGKRGRELAQKEFSADSIADKFEALYRKIIVSVAPVPLPITAIILTHNEEINIKNCLDSIKNWVSQIIIIDSYSTDRTQSIAQEYSCEIYEHPFKYQADQFNWALDNAKIKNDWILRLDADEYMLPELWWEIGGKLNAVPENITGFYMKRRVYFMGRWIRYGGYYPSWFLRLWRRGRARVEDREMDEHTLLLEGQPGYLENDFVDDNRKDLESWIAKHNNFSTREARERLKAGDSEKERLLGGQVRHKRWFKNKIYLRLPLFLRSLVYFLYRYFFRLGFLDGREGLIFHFLQGFWHQFLIDAKIHEAKLKKE